MATFKPGTQEGLKFSPETGFNDKGTLVISMEVALSDEELLAALENDSATTEMKQSFFVFPPNMVIYGKTDKKSGKAILNEINAYKARFLEYAELVGTKEEATSAFGGLKMFEGIVPREGVIAFIATLNVEANMTRVFHNLCKKFVDYMKSKPGFTTTAFRHKFYRQSKARHFATIPWNIYGPIVEPMTIPVEQSAIKWSEGEIKAGKMDSTPSEKTPANTTQASQAKQLFPGAAPTPAPIAGMPTPQAQAFAAPQQAPATQAEPQSNAAPSLAPAAQPEAPSEQPTQPVQQAPIGAPLTPTQQG